MPPNPLTQGVIEAMARAAFEARSGRYMEWDELKAKHPGGAAQWIRDFEIGIAHLPTIGWALVPVEATWGVDKMTGAGAQELPAVDGIDGIAGRLARDVYAAMLAAAPKFGDAS